jgi:group I intron endonuclease
MEFIYNGLSKSGGTYKITNKTNGRVYIGSAKCFQVRWSQHAAALEKQNHSNRFLMADYQKCGQDSFAFEVIEVISGSKQERITAEQVLLDVYFDGGLNCYNLRKNANSREGSKSQNPEEAFKKASNASKEKWQNPEYRKKIPHGVNKGKTMPFKGIPRSEEAKKKIRETKLGHVVSSETKEKIAAKARERMGKKEKRQECAERQRQRWQDPDYRTRMLATNTFVLNSKTTECPFLI